MKPTSEVVGSPTIGNTQECVKEGKPATQIELGSPSEANPSHCFSVHNTSKNVSFGPKELSSSNSNATLGKPNIYALKNFGNGRKSRRPVSAYVSSHQQTRKKVGR